MRISLTPNKVIKYLILSNLAFETGWGILSPVFAIFIVERIKGGNALVVGVAAAVFWLSRSLLRIPISVFLDTRPTEKDDYFALMIGTFITSLMAFGFLLAETPWHIYLLQGGQGLGSALAYAGFMAIFTRHLDKGKESTEWGLNATSVGIGLGVAGAIGGWAVTEFGFEPVFIMVGILGLFSTMLLFGLRNEIKGVFDHGLHFSVKDVFRK